MSGVICLRSESNDAWVKAGWAYRQVLEDTLAACPEDCRMANEFAFARDTGYLYVDQLEPNLASRITDAMRQMIERTRAGKVRTGLADKPYGTAETIEQYVESLAELSLLIPPPMEKQAGT